MTTRTPARRPRSGPRGARPRDRGGRGARRCRLARRARFRSPRCPSGSRAARRSGWPASGLYGSYGDGARGAESALCRDASPPGVAAGDGRCRPRRRGPTSPAMAADLERLRSTSRRRTTPRCAATWRSSGSSRAMPARPTCGTSSAAARGRAGSGRARSRAPSRRAAGARRRRSATLDGWRAAEPAARGGRTGSDGIRLGDASAPPTPPWSDPEWLADEIGMVPRQVAAFVDFAAFVRLSVCGARRPSSPTSCACTGPTTRHSSAPTTPASSATSIGVAVAEAGYLAGVDRPFGSVRGLETALLAAMLVEVARGRGTVRAGGAIGRDRRSSSGVGASTSTERTRLRNSGMMRSTGDPSCVRSGRGSSAR